MSTFAIFEAPSILGLGPTGVEMLPEALLRAGLAESLNAKRGGLVPPPAFSAVRGADTQILNASGIRDYALQLCAPISESLALGDFPIVMGGDCSILTGTMLALRRRGRYGLLFLDGHMDFYSPQTSPTGEAADMDLAIVTGRGPDIVTKLDGYRPLVRDEDVVVLGHRDGEDASRDGAPTLPESIVAFDFTTVRRMGAGDAARAAMKTLARPELEGFWIHLDADVLADDVMPAVDYRMPGGLSFDELGAVIRIAMASGRAVGMEITIFNPKLDPNGTIAAQLVDCLQSALVTR